jgi:hypothetical protein
MWGPGRGGRAGSTPEAIRLSEALSGICREYLERFPQDAPFINAGLEQVPTDWLNQRLVELGEMWQVDGNDTFRTLRPVDHLPQPRDTREMILLGEPSLNADKHVAAVASREPQALLKTTSSALRGCLGWEPHG